MSAAFRVFPFPGPGLSTGGRVSLFSLWLSACGQSGAPESKQVGLGSFALPESTSAGSNATNTTSSALPTSSGASLVGEFVPVEVPVDVCAPAPSSMPTFGAEGVTSPFPNPSGRALYSWTTVQQAQELLAGTPLLNRTERPDLGPGYAIEYLTAEYVPKSESERALLNVLTSEQFSRARYAWPHAWATRMGWPATSEAPAETYGDQLLEVVVKQNALWIVVGQSQLWVVGQDGTRWTTETAIAESHRIVGVFFNNDASLGAATCGSCGSFRGNCNRGVAASAYREFIIMNPSMIESWSLGTDEIRSVVRADIQLLTQFFEAIRACPSLESFENWAGTVVCRSWENTGTEQGAYEARLAVMSPSYQPRPAELAAIISTLEADLAAWTITIDATSTEQSMPSDAGASFTSQAPSSASGADADASAP